MLTVLKQLRGILDGGVPIRVNNAILSKFYLKSKYSHLPTEQAQFSYCLSQIKSVMIQKVLSLKLYKASFSQLKMQTPVSQKYEDDVPLCEKQDNVHKNDTLPLFM